MAGIEITDEMTSEQLEAMTGGEQLKAEVYGFEHSYYFPVQSCVKDLYDFPCPCWIHAHLCAIVDVTLSSGRLLWPDKEH